MNKFSLALKEARLKMNLTQEDVAEMVGKTKNVVSNWERGDNKPNLDIIEILCRNLDINPNDIISYNTKSTAFLPLSSLDRIHLTEYQKLNDSGKIKATEYVKDLQLGYSKQQTAPSGTPEIRLLARGGNGIETVHTSAESAKAAEKLADELENSPEVQEENKKY